MKDFFRGVSVCVYVCLRVCEFGQDDFVLVPKPAAEHFVVFADLIVLTWNFVCPRMELIFKSVFCVAYIQGDLKDMARV